MTELKVLLYSARRIAINYFYILFGSPSREDLSNIDLVSEICRHLINSAKSKRLELNILNEIISKNEEDVSYSSKQKLNTNTSIKYSDLGVRDITDLMEDGCIISQTTFLVNSTRKKDGKKTAAFSTVYLQCSQLIQRSIRKTKVIP